MTLRQSSEWLDGLFIYDINELERLGNLRPSSQYALVHMSGIVRRLLIDKQPLVHHAKSRCSLPLIFLVPEQISGHPSYDANPNVPPLILKYAPEISERSHPGGRKGYFHCSYTLDEYLKSTAAVLPSVNSPASLVGRAITPYEMILFFAHKMGGVHADRRLTDNDSLEAETLYRINEKVKIFGEGALFNQFGIVGERVWRACAPLRDELLEKK